jgi:hypothetical protein
MEFCPHCGLHLKGHRDFCRHCGPAICWWFQNQAIVDKLGLTEEESWREENGEVHPRGWERKEDGHYHPFSWVQSKSDGRYYPSDWVRDEWGVYAPPNFRLA